MNQISEEEFRDAIIATKKDAKLVAAAKNDRTNSPETLYREFIKLTLDRQREIISQVSNESFVSANWKVAFVLNNTPQANLADTVLAAGKALFYSREQDGVKGTLHALRLYQDSPFFKTVAAFIGEAAEMVRGELYSVVQIFLNPEIYGMIRGLDPAIASSDRLVQSMGRVASYTRDLNSTKAVASFLHARRYSALFDQIASLLENSIFMARDRNSVREILAGLGAGSVDRVLQQHANNKQVLSNIRDISWKTRDAEAIRNYLDAL
jgi:hypothetical protein